MSNEILFNSPALHALKRHQLVSLSKRYGLRASGKNVEMIDRLKEYAATLTPTQSIKLPPPAPTPAQGISDFGVELESSPTSVPSIPLAQRAPASRLPNRRHSGASENWEVLSEGEASLISPPKKPGMTKSSSVRSWKSAGNGESLSEFGVEAQPSSSLRSKSSPLRSLASSLSRRGTIHLMHRSGSASSQLDKLAADEQLETPAPPVKQSPSPFRALAMTIGRSASQHHPSRPSPPSEQVEQTGMSAETGPPDPDQDIEAAQPCPPSPASTVGVPRRRSLIPLRERPSTLSLVSPEPAKAAVDEDDLPFFDSAQVSKRRSMAPLRTTDGGRRSNLNRKSMPAISSVPQAYVPGITNIYPRLPLPVDAPAVPQIPGAYRKEPTPSPPKPSSGFGISNEQFDLAGRKVLEEMQAKMQAALGDRAGSFGEELLKGKKAEVGKLVQTRADLGEGGWGLKSMASSCSIQDRYAAAHQREFARMQSINGHRKKGASTFRATSGTGTASLSSSTASGSNVVSSRSKASLLELSGSDVTAKCLPPQTPGKRKLSHAALNTPSAPNGAPLIDAAGEPASKRKKMSPGPNALGSLRDAGRSLVHLLGDGHKGGMTPGKKRRRSSLNTGRGLASRFGMFKSRHQASLTQSTASSAAKSALPKSSTTSSLATSTASSRSATSTFSSGIAHQLSSTLNVTAQADRERHRSASAQTIMSSSTKTPTRPSIPDFGPARPLVRSGSINALGLPSVHASSSSASSRASMKKQSHADIIRTARPAPAPPIEELMEYTENVAPVPRPATIKRSSTLYAPTASSIARMQATVKPTAERPLPATPNVAARPIATTKPYGLASSRSTLDSSFNVPAPTQGATTAARPLKSALKTPAMPSPRKTPSKQTSSSALRVRQKASGVSAVKSKMNAKGDAEVLARRAEIRARQQRMGEERELRELLGAPNGVNDVEMA